MLYGIGINMVLQPAVSLEEHAASNYTVPDISNEIKTSIAPNSSEGRAQRRNLSMSNSKESREISMVFIREPASCIITVKLFIFTALVK